LKIETFRIFYFCQIILYKKSYINYRILGAEKQC